MKVFVLLCCALSAAMADVRQPSMVGWLGTEGVAAYERHVRVVGGVESVPNSIPYQAGLLITIGDGRIGFCGGSILTNTKILTAAHCWFDGQNQGVVIQVVLGAHRINDVESTSVRQNTDNVVLHPEWTPSIIRNDIGVVTLVNPVSFTDAISPVLLPSGSQLTESFSGDFATVSGWGLASDSATAISPTLQQADLRVIAQLVCRVQYPTIIQETNICTSGEDGKGPCSGDSGGPLVVTRNGQTILIGVVSFGLGFGCELNWPGVFARVTAFMPWISAQL